MALEDEAAAAGNVIVILEPSALVIDVVVEPSLLVTEELVAPASNCSNGSEPALLPEPDVPVVELLPSALVVSLESPELAA